MADVITRFKLETTQYDSKLRDAAQGLSKLSQQLQLAGKDFDKFAQKDVEFAKSLGQIESGANNLKDKLKDLVGAYNNVARAYNDLTNEQKKTDFGKAMASSLDQLKERISQTKNELYNTTNAMGGLKDKLTVNIDAFKLFSAGLAAVKGALSVAKDAFFASEQNLDDWQRTVYTSKSVYEGFLTSLNTGDISGFLSNINTIVSAATDAYNAIDRLQTMQNIQNPKLLAKQTEVQRMETMLRTGRYIAPADGRKPAMAEGTILTDEQKKTIARQLESAMKEIAALIKNQVSAANDAIDALYREQAARLGMTLEQFRKGVSSMEVFESNLQKAQAYRDYEAAHTQTVSMNTSAGVIRQNVRDNTPNPYEAYKGWAVFKDDGELYQRILSYIGERTGMEQQYYSQVGRAYRGINKAEGVTGGGGGVSNTVKTVVEDTKKEIEDIFVGLDGKIFKILDSGIETNIGTMLDNMKDAITAKMAERNAIIDETTFGTLLKVAVENGLDAFDLDFSALQEKMAEGLNIPDEEWEKLQEKINEKLKEMGIEPIKINLETGEIDTTKKESKEQSGKETYATDALAKVSSGINSMVSSMEQLGVEIPSGLKEVLGGINAVVSILTTISAVMEAIEAIQSATSFMPFFANGGIVPKAANGYFVQGTHFSNDVTPVMANAGELILNRAAQGNIASQLQTSGMAMGGGTPYVSGEQIFLGLNNYLSRTGRGELITSR